MKVIPVKNLKHVDASRYIEGDLFLTDKKIAILHGGKIEPLVKESEMKEYVKKKDVVTLIETQMKQVKSE